MAFPKTALPVKVELYYSGAWQDISADVNSLDNIVIVRGRSREGASPDPSSCNLTLRNPTGKYSPRNPASPLYGLIGRNTPIRVSAQLNGVWYQRFIGEVTAWPQKWGKKGAQQSMAPIECAGILRRLGQGASPLRSALWRSLPAIGSNLVGYWPCEDAKGSTTLEVRVGQKEGRILAGAPTLSEYDAFKASAPLPKVGSSRWSFGVAPYASTGTIQIRFLANIPASTPNNAVLLRVWTDSTLGWYDLVYGTGGSLKVQPYTRYGVATTPLGPIAFGVDGKDLRIDLTGAQSGANINFTVSTLAPGAGSGSTSTQNIGVATLGACTRIDVNPDGAALADLVLGHLTVEEAITSIFAQGLQLAAYLGERATDRIARLCTEAGIGYAWPSDDGTSPRLGCQGRLTLVDLLAEAASIGHGNLHERRSTSGLFYRPLSSVTTQTAASATIPYVDNLLRPFEPVDDDSATRNKVTVTKDGGTSATVEDTTSRLSTQAPPNGVGIYDEAVTLSLADDGATKHHAGWRVHLGTVDEARWPQIGLDLAHPAFVGNTALAAAVVGLSMGDRLDVTQLPAWLPPDPVQSIVQGYTETIEPFHWKIVFNCTPYRPYRAARFKTAGVDDRWSNSTTTLSAGITATATTLQAAFTSGPRWTAADGSFDILLSGERMTVTAVTGTTSPQTFTVTRAVNGVSKAHTAGEPIALADPVYFGL